MKFLANLKLQRNNKLGNIKVIRGLTGKGLAEAKDLTEKLDPHGEGREAEVILSGDQIAGFYVSKNRGFIPAEILLTNIRDIPQVTSVDLTV